MQRPRWDSQQTRQQAHNQPRPPPSNTQPPRPPGANHLGQFLRHPSLSNNHLTQSSQGLHLHHRPAVYSLSSSSTSPAQQRPVLRPRCLPAWFQPKPPLSQPDLSQLQPVLQPQPVAQHQPLSQLKPVSQPPQLQAPHSALRPLTKSTVTSPGEPETPTPGSTSSSSAASKSLQDRLQLLVEPSPLQPPPVNSAFDIPLPLEPAPRKTIPLDEQTPKKATPLEEHPQSSQMTNKPQNSAVEGVGDLKHCVVYPLPNKNSTKVLKAGNSQQQTALSLLSLAPPPPPPAAPPPHPALPPVQQALPLLPPSQAAAVSEKLEISKNSFAQAAKGISTEFEEPCPHCALVCQSATALATHIKFWHSNNKDINNSSNINSSRMRTLPGKKEKAQALPHKHKRSGPANLSNFGGYKCYKCPHCPALCDSQTQLENHTEVCHNNRPQQPAQSFALNQRNHQAMAYQHKVKLDEIKQMKVKLDDIKQLKEMQAILTEIEQGRLQKGWGAHLNPQGGQGQLSGGRKRPKPVESDECGDIFSRRSEETHSTEWRPKIVRDYSKEPKVMRESKPDAMQADLKSPLKGQKMSDFETAGDFFHPKVIDYTRVNRDEKVEEMGSSNALDNVAEEDNNRVISGGKERNQSEKEQAIQVNRQSQEKTTSESEESNQTGKEQAIKVKKQSRERATSESKECNQSEKEQAAKTEELTLGHWRRRLNGLC